MSTLRRAQTGSPLDDLLDMELVGDHMMMVAVPRHASAQLRANVVAAMKAANIGFRSIDYVLKRYGKNWRFDDDKPPNDPFAVENILKTIQAEANYVADALCSEITRPSIAGLLVAEAALVRLSASFSSALLLIRQGHAFEASAIARLILEQLSWAIAVYRKLSEEDALAVQPQSTLSYLKDVVPFAGKLYGLLSEQAHMAPEETMFYVELSPGVRTVRLQLHEHCFQILYYIAVLADIYLIVAQRISGSYMAPRSEYAPTYEGERPLVRLIRHFEQPDDEADF